MPNGMLGNDRTLHDIVCGPLTDLLEKLNGREGEEWLVALKRFLRKERVVWPTFEVWKTIEPTLGGYGKNWFLGELERKGVWVASRIEFLLKHANFTWERGPTRLVRVYASQLGFSQTTSRADIYKQAQLHGLGICCRDVGPLLRLQYLDQPFGETLIVGSEPIFDDEDPDALGLFVVSGPNSTRLPPELSWADGRPEATYAPSSIWVFAWR